MLLPREYLLYIYLLFCAFLEFQAIRIGGFRLNLLLFSTVGLIMLALFLIRPKDLVGLFSRPYIVLSLYIFWCLLTASWSYIGLESVFHVLPILIASLVAVVFRSTHPDKLAKAYILLAIALCILAVLLLVINSSLVVLPDVVWRLSGLFAHPQRAALFMSGAMLFLIVYAANNRDQINLKLCFALFLTLFLALIATKARAFSVMFVAVVVFIIYYMVPNRLRKLYALGVLLGGFLLYFLQALIFQILSRDADMDSSLTGRIPTWILSIELIRDRPILGYGFASFFSDLTIESDRDYVSPHAHNTWINAAVETGIVGAILVTVYLFYVFYSSLRYQRILGRISYAGALSLYVFLCGFTGVVIGGKVSTLMAILFLVHASEQKVLKGPI